QRPLSKPISYRHGRRCVGWVVRRQGGLGIGAARGVVRAGAVARVSRISRYQLRRPQGMAVEFSDRRSPTPATIVRDHALWKVDRSAKDARRSRVARCDLSWWRRSGAAQPRVRPADRFTDGPALPLERMMRNHLPGAITTLSTGLLLAATPARSQLTARPHGGLIAVSN